MTMMNYLILLTRVWIFDIEEYGQYVDSIDELVFSESNFKKSFYMHLDCWYRNNGFDIDELKQIIIQTRKELALIFKCSKWINLQLTRYELAALTFKHIIFQLCQVVLFSEAKPNAKTLLQLKTETQYKK